MLLYLTVPSPEKPKIVRALATHPFVATQTIQLSIIPGDMLTVLSVGERGWSHVENKEKCVISSHCMSIVHCAQETRLGTDCLSRHRPVSRPRRRQVSVLRLYSRSFFACPSDLHMSVLDPVIAYTDALIVLHFLRIFS